MWCVCESGDGKELEKCRDFFFPFHMTECVFILTPCSINAIPVLIVMNNIRKELVMLQHIMRIKSQQIRAQNQSRSIILILIVNKSKNKINPN